MSSDKRKKFDRAMKLLRQLNRSGGRVLNPTAMRRMGKMRFIQWMQRRGLIRIERLHFGRRRGLTVIRTGEEHDVR